MIPGLYANYQKQWGQNTIWIISDLHFGDKELRKGITKRPSDEQLLKNINSCVGKKDTLIVLGDVGDLSYVRKLKGYKVLIKGNHDAGSSLYQREIFYKRYPQDYISYKGVKAEVREIFPEYSFSIDEGFGFHNPFDWWEVTLDNRLFDEVYEGALIIGEKLILSHEPIANINWALNLHGHNHFGIPHPDKYHYNFNADVINYKPINLNKFMKEGYLSKIPSIHRLTIDSATERKQKRKNK